MNDLKSEAIKYLEELLERYADAQDMMTFYYEAPDAHLNLKPTERRGKKVEHWKKERDDVREQIIRLFL